MINYDSLDCFTCGEQPVKVDKCLKSKRSCGDHCNCSWIQDICCWCGKEFGEDDENS